MKRAAAILIDTILFIALLLALAVVLVLAAGFLEMAFAWKIFSSTPGLITLGLLILAFACWLAFLGPKAVFNQTAGQSLAFRSQVHGLKPFYYYLGWLGILAGAYLVMWLVSATVLGTVARNQEKVVRALGIPEDWRQAFPEYSERDNAAPPLRLACDSLKKSDPAFNEATIEWAFRAVTEKQDSAAAAWPAVDQLVVLNKIPLGWFDQASKQKTLCWQDYRKVPIDSMIILPLPNYIALQNLCKLSMLQAARAMQKGQAQNARDDIYRSIRILRLQLADPTLIGKMVSLAQVGIISNGLAAIARTDPRSFALVRAACDSLPDIAGQTEKGIVAEVAVIGSTIWGRQGNSSLLRLSPLISQERSAGGKIAMSLFGNVLYRIWSPWDRYCYLKMSEISLLLADPKNGEEAVAEYERQSEDFYKKRQRLPALFSSMAMPSFAGMYRRELEARAKPANVLLFAAVLDYRKKNGKWPKDLAALVPGYFSEQPRNLVDGQHYTYMLSKDRIEVRGNDPRGEPLLKSTWVKY